MTRRAHQAQPSLQGGSSAHPAATARPSEVLSVVTRCGALPILALGIALLPLAGEALAAPAIAQETGTWSAAEMVLPGETCSGLFIVPLTVDAGRDATLHMLLDTGSAWTFVDPEAMHRVFGPQVRGGKVLFRDARIGAHELDPFTARVHPVKTVGRAMGFPIDGIIGFPAFREVLLTLDYPGNEVRVSSGRLPAPDGHTILHDVGRKRPELRIDVGGRRVRIVLDSGSTGRFQLKPTDRLTWAVEPRPAVTTVTFWDVRFKQGGRLAGALQFGPLRFETPVTLVAAEERIVGWHALRHFVLTFDQKNERIRMRAVSSDPVRMGSLVGTGLGFRPRSDGLEVVRVFPGTSAEAAGLREGDRVVAIDGIPAEEPGCEVRDEPAGVSKVVSYVRDGVAHEATILTEALVP